MVRAEVREVGGPEKQGPGKSGGGRGVRASWTLLLGQLGWCLGPVWSWANVVWPPARALAHSVPPPPTPVSRAGSDVQPLLWKPKAPAAEG